MKLFALIEPLTIDMQAIASFLEYTPKTMPDMYSLLRKVSIDRAYDDNHSQFKVNPNSRILDYDGREYCFYYTDGINDDHVRTLLKHILKNWNQN